MAGNPKARAKRQLDRPDLRKNVPTAVWRKFTIAEKIENLLGMNLDDAFVISGWDPNECDVHQLSAKLQVFRVVVLVAAKFGLQAQSDRARLEQLKVLAKAMERAKNVKMIRDVCPDIASDKTHG